MKQALFVATLTIALTACGANQGNPPASSQTPVAATSVASGTALPEALPQGFVLKFPYHFTKLSTGPDKDGQQRQRFTVEFLDGDATTVMGSLSASAIEAGFRNGNWAVRKPGIIHFAAGKPGYGQMRAEIRAVDKKMLSNPSAKGTVVMGWPMQPSTPQLAEAAVDAEVEAEGDADIPQPQPAE